MGCDLDIVFGSMSQTMSTALDNTEPLLFSAQTLPHLPLQLQTDRLIIKRRFHEDALGSDRPLLCFQADKVTYRRLGLLLLSIVFAAAPDCVHLELTHPGSDMKHLLIDYPYRSYDPDESFVTRQYGFHYCPTVPSSQASLDDPEDRPVFHLTTPGGGTLSDESWKNWDTLRGFGLEGESVRFAELLLNLSLSANPVTDYAVEGQGGAHGHGIQSADAHICLPGSSAWEDGSEGGLALPASEI